MNVLSIDYGTRKCGLAYGIEGYAWGLYTVPTVDILHTIQQICSEKNIQQIVVGMPYHIDGSMSMHGRRVHAWIEKLEKVVHIPVHTHDERMTSSEARIGISQGVDTDVDTEAARLILEEYISGK
jgi:putative Holliday junction resolvase